MIRPPKRLYTCKYKSRTCTKTIVVDNNHRHASKTHQSSTITCRIDSQRPSPNSLPNTAYLHPRPASRAKNFEVDHTRFASTNQPPKPPKIVRFTRVLLPIGQLSKLKMSAHRESVEAAKLPSTFNEPVHLGIIGGTGLYHLPSLEPVARLTISTPWGAPSSAITISKTSSGFNIAFLARHGVHHDLLPTNVPSRANIAALKSLGVKAIVAFSAVGSLKQEIAPRDFVVPNQIIDRTKGIRDHTFFERGFVAHAGFGEPFDPKLSALISKFGHVLEGDQVKMHSKQLGGDDVTVICMEGPAFSTRAESRLYQSWGGSVINMSVIPEAKLAREAEIAYQMICMSTDYDAWREEEEPVTVETVVGNLKANSANANKLASEIIGELEKEIISGNIGNDLAGSMKMAVSTAPTGVKRELLEKMHFLFPGYWEV